jgi:dethiobiotin synthetase
VPQPAGFEPVTPDSHGLLQTGPLARVAPAFFITSPDTGAGKTVLAAWLVRRLSELGWKTRAAKPVASGSRDDAEALAAAAGDTPAAVNPWCFSRPVAPSLAAQWDGRRVELVEVLHWLNELRAESEVVVVEGAGGLLSPLGCDFDNRILLSSIEAFPVVVCPNRLGAISQARLTLEALPLKLGERSALVLVDTAAPDESAAFNAAVLRNYWPRQRVVTLPWRSGGATIPIDDGIRTAIEGILPPHFLP